MSPLIETERLTRILPETVPVTLVKDVTLSIGEKEFVAVTGPSGSGKSSLLYLLGLLDSPTSGTLKIGGRDTGPMDEKERSRTRLSMMGFVFQFHFLLPEFTARENVEIPMRKLRRLERSQIRERASELLISLGLAEHLDKRPDQLSGGQRQRVAVARSLANDPPIILADEPTGSLDSKSSEQVFEILQHLVRERGKSIVAVTHDLEMAARMDRRIHLVDGKIAEVVPG
ncbi:ABC transporter ATP-binding protein [Aminobacter sp. NyZ550]|jgi:lipoprotein-releasing system ATP-binding protein|uniref:ATP-binding protein n=1 Tax=Aminobacter aminovorans TaxID=83263 RepID=A0AAC8YQ16_AMIAI|nr:MULTISPECIES: ABC transporter ATP-binding protein [Aminobacter]AMS42176.1 ATP-binding protein [Aminobacter aminovorans]MBB3706583.1 lipoprotein-releasing system ATP-binding protein [Aminobacter aminovorans]QOF71364.1 ABC transporter ATP-binding protein [Aminobacter sp. SR38]WAX93089.1 ABC transporter ATP-binding protein [Aminobacter sp. NyZ550]WMC94785.1 ABC transporter ATP-binding protein [Aminobacter aminovorans]